MATDEEISAVSAIENAKKSDGTSTAGEHNVDKVNDVEPEEQSNENLTIDEENRSGDKVKTENNKGDIDEIEKDKMKINDSNEEEQDETILSITTNKKNQIIEPSTDETNPKVPNEELTVV